MAVERRGRLTHSSEHTGSIDIEAGHREYFFIVCTEGAIRVSFGEDDTGGVPLLQGGYYEPDLAPCGEIHVRGTGTYVIHVA